MQNSSDSIALSGMFPVPGVLLTEGNHGGTLAAARLFGSAGLHVVLADSDSATLAGASRFVSRRFRCPAYKNTDAFVAWLMAFGAKYPGYFLYGTSDDVVFLLARERERLASCFRLYQPSEQTIFSLSNKQLLYAMAREIGIETPGTFYPSSTEDVELLVRTLDYPLIVKPKTQLGLSLNVRGMLCRTPLEVRRAFYGYQQKFPYAPWVHAYDPTLCWPMIQAWFDDPATQTYSLSGFLSKENDIYLARGAQKVLQQPLDVGIGLAFESRPLIEKISEKVRQLALRSGYYGVFEVEFVRLAYEDRYLLTEFNPRFYGQMGFDIMRGMPLGHLALAGALGDVSTMRGLVKTAGSWDHRVIYKYRIHWMLQLLVTTQWLGGKVSAAMRRYWLAWAREGNVYDPLCDAMDKGPFFKYVWRHMLHILRHPYAAFSYYFR